MAVLGTDALRERLLSEEPEKKVGNYSLTLAKSGYRIINKFKLRA